VKPKPPVPWWRWAAWYAVLVPALVVFYGLFTPFWFGLRSLAWLAEFRARRHRRAPAAGEQIEALSRTPPAAESRVGE
jgi:hypothetical protein